MRRAVVLAAGRGTRLRGLAAGVPKPLLEVGGRPLLGRILDGLAAAGVVEVAVVVGHRAETIEARRAELAPSGVGITFLRQDPLDGTAHALLLARGFAREEPFILGWGDILVEPRTYRALAAAARDGSEVLAVNEVDDPHAGAAVYASDDGRVTRIVEKPARGTSDTRWNNAGLCVLGPGAWPFVDAVVPSPRGEYELASAIEAYVASGAVVRAMPVLGSWFDVGTPEDLARARAAFGA